MNNNKDEKIGTIKISDEVVGICAANGAIKTSGVHKLSGGITDSISKNILGKESSLKGIKINRNGDIVELDVFIIVEYDVNIPAIAWDVQKNVKNEVEHITDLEVRAVNIHVQGVYIPELEEQSDEQ